MRGGSRSRGCGHIRTGRGGLIIAVLPFANLGRAEDQHLSDGISEEILNVLAQIPDLQVAARTSAFARRGEEVMASEIARSLGVAFLLDGSVRRSSNVVRIHAPLPPPTAIGRWQRATVCRCRTGGSEHFDDYGCCTSELILMRDGLAL